MKLSIITINYNNQDGLQKTIDSVINQTFTDFEWIIIDGGSTDGSKKLIERYTDKISYWVSEHDKGIYNAMNKGIRVAHGEYLLFLNSGDYLFDKDVLYKVVPLLQDKDFYVGNLFNGRLLNPNIDNLCTTLFYSTFPHQASFIHRNNFVKYGEYREDLQIVSDWWLLFVGLILGNSTIGKIPFTISTYDVHGVSSKEKKKLIAERERCFSEIESEGVRGLCDFYRRNSEILEALKGTNWFFFLFRVYYYIYRKWINKN